MNKMIQKRKQRRKISELRSMRSLELKQTTKELEM